MKRLYIYILFAMVWLSAAAQNVEYYTLDNPTNRIRPGIRAGWEYTMPGALYLDGKPIKTFVPGHGLMLGGFVHIPLWHNLYIEPAVSLYYNTYEYDNIVVYGTDDDGNDTLEYIYPEVRKVGFNIPVPVGFHFDLWDDASVALNTGPMVQLGISNLVSINSKYLGLTDIKHDNYSLDGDYRRIDLAWQMGLSGRVHNWRLDISLAIGLLDLHKGPYNFHEYRVTASLGYLF